MRILSVLLNGDEIASVELSDPPIELTPSLYVERDSVIEFVSSDGRRHVHSLADLSGWAHISVRVHETLACQSDCIVTDAEICHQAELLGGTAKGVRFQPFLLPGAAANRSAFVGQGLFRRGLHFPGRVTPGSVRLSCECDFCGRSFQVQSFHAGLAEVGYMYSASGAYTLIIDAGTPGCPPAIGQPDVQQLRRLESVLPLAPDGTTFRYSHSFRCPHCHEAYINFVAHPELRQSEYYGNYIFGTSPIPYEPSRS